MKIFKINLFLSFIILFGFANICEAQTSIGYVLEIRGNWYLNNTEKLRVGQEVPPDGRISVQARQDGDYITIANISGANIIGSRQCPSNCKPLKLPRTPEPSSMFSIAWQALMKRIYSSPPERVEVVSRGEKMVDGVAKAESGKINLKPFFKEEGQYIIRWREISENAKKNGEWSEPFDLKINKTNDAVISELKPGLYEFGFLRRMGNQLEPLPETIWIFITSADNYQKAFEEHQRLITLIEKWDAKVKAKTVDLILRTHLDNLANEYRQ